MSNLTFNNTQQFREQLLLRNLESSYGYSTTLPVNFTDSTYGIQSTNNLSVVNQDDVDVIGTDQLNTIGVRNPYGPESYSFIDIRNLVIQVNERLDYLNSFVPQINQSSSGLISILSGGDFSGDSKMSQIARETLRTMTLVNMGVKLDRSTIGRINAIEAINSPEVVEGLLTGREPIIERDYQITVPGNPITRAAEYFGRISGVELPVSYIPGEFFEDNVDKGNTEKFFDKAKEWVGKALNLDFTSGKKTYSQKLLQYTSGGQKSALFRNVNYNKYLPNYDTTTSNNLVNNVVGFVQGLIGTDPPNGSFYIGSDTVDVSRLFYTNIKNEEKGYVVSGPSRLVSEFEGITPKNTYPENSEKYLIGTDKIGVETSFVWVGDNSVPRDTIDGVANQSNEKLLDEIPNSILYKTQQMVNDASELEGEDRLKHPGTVIDQLSYKYHDGYKTISKGNAVKNEDGDYCRVWTKDRAYSQHDRLVRYKGIQDTQRRVPGSVIKSQMMLNIAPTLDKDGKPINFGLDQEGNNITKYMFSLENLAWKGSEKLKERPICEQGPNGGRIMWFPPYALTYTDDNRANWTSHTFLGRPEPIYTYNNAERTGTLNFKVVVDHPSIANLIAKKNKNLTPEQKQGILESFFAGCVDYDIYELAQEFDFLSETEITTLGQYLDAYGYSGKIKTDGQIDGEPIITDPKEIPGKKIDPYFDYSGRQVKLRLYWFNDIPKYSGPVHNPTTDYGSDLTSYIGMRDSYITKANLLTGAVQEGQDSDFIDWEGQENIEKFFDETLNGISTKLVEIKDKVHKTLKQHKNFKFRITLRATTSAVATQEYNDGLAQRRANSAKKYFLEGIDGVDDSRIEIQYSSTGENKDFDGINCNTIQQDLVNGVDERIYSKSATYCRTADMVLELIGDGFEDPEIIPGKITPTKEWVEGEDEIKQDPDFDPIDFLLKSISSECDYFTELTEKDPLVFNNLVDKLQYFHPAFHSTTPEGLNSRLTFLLQCLRPGETIKVMDENDNLIDNISSNTSFGRPPICILRIGDFYHTKVVIDNVNISYDENLYDMNPEGIGLQPMIASVNMGIKFIGGQGIGDVVNKLQNALSFNFFANTEVYEPMADKTKGGRDEEYFNTIRQSVKDKFTEQLVDVLNNQELSPDNDDYWGNLEDGEDETTITYNQFYNQLIEETNQLVSTIQASISNLTENYDSSLLVPLFKKGDKDYIQFESSYGLGDVYNFDYLVGSPRPIFNYDNFISDVFTKLVDKIEDINNDFNDNDIYNEMKKKINFNENKKEDFRTIMLYVIDEVKKIYDNVSISKEAQNMFNAQNTLQKTIDAFDVILGSGIDGYKDKDSGEYVVKYLNDLNNTGGNLSSDVGDVYQKLDNYLFELLDELRTEEDEGFIAFDIEEFSKNGVMAQSFFINRLLHHFLQTDSFDIDQAVRNNRSLGNASVRKEFALFLSNLKNKQLYNRFEESRLPKWETLKEASGMYVFVLSDATNPTAQQPLIDYYDSIIGNPSGIELDAKFSWKNKISPWAVNYTPSNEFNNLA